MTPVLLIGGMTTGIFTPTEGAIAACLWAMVLGFGVLFIINNSIGLITPPVGTVLNVVAGVTRTTMEDLMKGVWPFLLAELAVLVLLILFPALVTVPARWLSG